MTSADATHAGDDVGSNSDGNFRGLSLAPFRALRPTATGEQLARRLSPPYDVISAEQKAALLAADPHNVVRVILPDAAGDADAYDRATADLSAWVRADVLRPDAQPSLYVYEMREPDGHATRGLVGAVELRAPEDGVILPHENTMAGPVADRLALMTATQADLEPIYLVYDGGGAASAVVRDANVGEPLADVTTPDQIRHRVWAISDPAQHETIAADLRARRALIADGHHRYATYRERQRRAAAEHGPGPWDRGLALLVDSSDYGPQVHAIHRVLPQYGFDRTIAALADFGVEPERLASLDAALEALQLADTFAVVVSDGSRHALVRDSDDRLAAASVRPDEPPALSTLDVALVHRGLIESALGLPDDEDSVAYAHTVDEAIALARSSAGVALLLRPTPVAAVAAVAAAGARMPRKSTLFTPKPASGLLLRRFADQH